MARGTLDIRRLSFPELTKLGDEIQRAIDGKVEAERQEIQIRLDQLSAFGGAGGVTRRPVGSATREVTGSSSRGSKLRGRKVPVKYRGPNGETWSGRGLAPRWLTELEDAGEKRESFLV